MPEMNPEKPDTPGSDPNDTGEGEPAAPDATAQAMKSVIDYIDKRISEGEEREEVIQDTATQIGWNPDDLVKEIDEGLQAGSGGQSILKGVATMMQTVQQQNLVREGQSRVEQLANDRDLGDAYTSNEDSFTKWLRRERINYTTLANPGQAKRLFKYFLTNETSYFEDKAKADRDKLEKEIREKVEAEVGVRRKAPAPPSLAPGAQPEGGGLRRIVDSAIGASDEPSENQLGVMRGLGLSEERMKRAMERQSKKSVYGTPLEFVPVENEGGVK